MPSPELTLIIALLIVHFTFKRNVMRVATTLLLFLFIESIILFDDVSLRTFIADVHGIGRSVDYVDGLKAMEKFIDLEKIQGSLSVLGIFLIALSGRAFEHRRGTPAGRMRTVTPPSAPAPTPSSTSTSTSTESAPEAGDLTNPDRHGSQSSARHT